VWVPSALNSGCWKLASDFCKRKQLPLPQRQPGRNGRGRRHHRCRQPAGEQLQPVEPSLFIAPGSSGPKGPYTKAHLANQASTRSAGSCSRCCRSARSWKRAAGPASRTSRWTHAPDPGPAEPCSWAVAGAVRSRGSKPSRAAIAPYQAERQQRAPNSAPRGLEASNPLAGRRCR